MTGADQRPTVLVVDDDRLNRMTLAELLAPDCRVLLARDGPSALTILAREPVLLVLLDVSMPGMDGYEVLRAIRAQERLADLTVIFITGMSDGADEERGLLLGAADFVPKPIRPVVVRARVMTHLKLALQRRDLEALATRDGLTGIANRRSFDRAMAEGLRRAQRSGEGLALALFDVDHFKQYNDLYGHGAGDKALRRVGAILQGFARRSDDLAARYGGEEFALLLTGSPELELVANRVREALNEALIPHEGSATAAHLTLSGGAVSWTGSQHSAERLLQEADRLLYQAKAAGRNRVLTCHLAD